MDKLTSVEERLFKRLASPSKIQDYLNTLRYNFEKNGITCMSPRSVIRTGRAHCIEGALLAAAILWYHGRCPMLLDLRSTRDDLDHVVALFKQNNCWGALSKTNHAVLRYREPIYRSIRELALSYFNEYFLDDGTKTLREYSKPFSLKKYGYGWITGEENLWHIGAAIDDSSHYPILPKMVSSSRLRKADPIEVESGKLLEYPGTST